jgi:hypothetical protein
MRMPVQIFLVNRTTDDSNGNGKLLWLTLVNCVTLCLCDWRFKASPWWAWRKKTIRKKTIVLFERNCHSTSGHPGLQGGGPNKNKQKK